MALEGIADAIKQLKRPFRRKGDEVDRAVVTILESMRVVLQQHEELKERIKELEEELKDADRVRLDA